MRTRLVTERAAREAEQHAQGRRHQHSITEHAQGSCFGTSSLTDKTLITLLEDQLNEAVNQIAKMRDSSAPKEAQEQPTSDESQASSSWRI